MALFKRLLGDLERVLYAVDELLRFRAGDSRFALIWKPALGLAWFAFTYFIRFGINLFVEPTFNPIKHFPVVTVTAKLIVPIIPALDHLFRAPIQPLVGRPFALLVSGTIIFFIPGLAGFLVWELKENWRLYRSNRSKTLDPVVVGSHGETILRFLRPGLHSGTIPKLFARLRRAQGAAANRQYEALGHVTESLRHFIERELLAVLAGSKRCAGAAVELSAVQLATNRIRFELACSALGGQAIALDLVYRQGSLTADVSVAGGTLAATWLARLTPAQQAALADAVAGFYKLAGIERIGSSIDFAAPLTWAAWVETWEQDQAGKAAVPLTHLPLLPHAAG
jgi:hypothetical protein